MPAKKKKLLKDNQKLLNYAIVALIGIISFFNLAIFLTPKEKKIIYTYEPASSSNSEQLISYWNTFLDKNPEYLPGWVELAKIHLENNQLSSALVSASKALEIDPNSELVKNTIESIDYNN